MRRQPITAAAYAAVLIAGSLACSPNTSSQPTVEPSAPTSTPPIPGFPDMSAYAAATLSDFAVSGPPTSGATLLTPDGMTCWLSSYPMPEYASVSCTGQRPDKGGGIWTVSAERNGETSVVQQHEMPSEPTAPALPERHVLNYESDVFCGVDDNGTTACRVGDHGFVLTPTSTKLF